MNENDITLAASSSDIIVYLEKLLAESKAVFSLSMTAPNSAKVAASHIFIKELGAWLGVLRQRRETELMKVAALEYEFALLALTQGQYRHAFNGLRLVLELILQAVYLSINELLLREWLDNRADTVWSTLTDTDQGVFSARFASVFFPELAPHVHYYRELAMSVYRECSECVHGNTSKRKKRNRERTSIFYEEEMEKLG